MISSANVLNALAAWAVLTVVFLPLLALWFYRWSRAPYTPPERPYQSRLGLPLWVKLAGCAALFVAPAVWAIVESWLKTHSFYYGIGPAARAYGRYLIVTVLTGSLIMQVALIFRYIGRVRRA